jgi:hypothetical protein
MVGALSGYVTENELFEIKNRIYWCEILQRQERRSLSFSYFTYYRACQNDTP